MLQYRLKIILLLLMGNLILSHLAFSTKLVSLQGTAYAAEETHTKQEHHAEDEHHGAPFIYYIDWLLLLITLGLVGSQLKLHLKKADEDDEEPHEAETHAAPAGARIPVFLIGLVAFIFLTESLSSVAHYHEPVGPGLIRLLIKLATGVLLMLYGLSFMHEH